MYGPAYHRRQAEILARIAKTVSNIDAAAALSALAAKHRALADEGERSAQQRKQILPKKDRRPSQSR
jgi:F0F1-type ATP synthase epsilon subunit